jgi:hypothetical protein
MTTWQDLEKQILVYAPDLSSDNLAKVEDLAAKHNAKLVVLHPKDFNRTLGQAVGLGTPLSKEGPGGKLVLEVSGDYTGEQPEESILYFAGFPHQDIPAFLKETSALLGDDNFDLKASLTPSNLGWRLIDHYEELMREHRMMKSFEFLYHADMFLNTMDAEEYETDSYEQFSSAVEEGRVSVELLKKGTDVAQDILDEQVAAINMAYRALKLK